MQAFLTLFQQLDRSTRTNDKTSALEAFYEVSDAADAAWATFFLTGQRLPAPVKAGALRQWVAHASGYPRWLVEASYERVGDLAETVALLLPETIGACDTHDAPGSLAQLIEDRILPLRGLDETAAAAIVGDTWQQLDLTGRLVYNKLLTGAFRVGVSRGLTLRALAKHAGLETSVLEHRLSGEWSPSAAFFRQILQDQESQADVARRPYPFMLAHQLDREPDALGPVEDWAAEWKWDGLRAQLLNRGGDVLLWSRGQELLSGAFPEIVQAAAGLPDGLALDGEIVGWSNGTPLPFTALQTRINRRRVTRASLLEAPCAFVAFDCLESAGVDLRQRSWSERRSALEAALAERTSDTLRLNPILSADQNSWRNLHEARQESRVRGVEGLMLKRRDSVYHAGRVTGPWWKWKVDPYAVDAVLVYAQAGHGRRAGWFTDFTFAVWEGETLVPFAKAYSGLTDEAFERLNRWINRHTIARQGPVRSVQPTHVFELHFENIAPSKRHQSGLAVRFPRIHRWRTDKRPEEADSLDQLRQLAANRPATVRTRLAQAEFTFD